MSLPKISCPHCRQTLVGFPDENGCCPACYKPLDTSLVADEAKSMPADSWLDPILEEVARERRKAATVRTAIGVLLLVAGLACLVIGAYTKGTPARVWGPRGIGYLSLEEAQPLFKEQVDGGYSAMRPILSMIDEEMAAARQRQTLWYVGAAVLGGLGVAVIASIARQGGSGGRTDMPSI